MVIFFRPNNLFLRTENGGLTVIDTEVEMNIIYFRRYEVRLLKEPQNTKSFGGTCVLFLVRLNLDQKQGVVKFMVGFKVILGRV